MNILRKIDLQFQTYNPNIKLYNGLQPEYFS